MRVKKVFKINKNEKQNSAYKKKKMKEKLSQIQIQI